MSSSTLKKIVIFFFTLCLIFITQIGVTTAETMTIHKGTNIIGIPDLTENTFTNCNLLNYVSSSTPGCIYNDNGYFVYYNPLDNQGDCNSNFFSTNAMTDGLGYYLYAESECEISFNSPASVQVTLYPGINIISVPVETRLSDIAQVCGSNIFTYFSSSSTPGCIYDNNGYFVQYDPENLGDCGSRFRSTSTLEPFIGYYVYFNGKDGETRCRFRYEDGNIIPITCDEQCKAQGFSSGVCRAGVDGEQGFTLYRYTSFKTKDSVSDTVKYFDMTQSWEYTGNQVQQIHAIRPDFKALFYRNVRAVYPYWKDEWELFKANNWVLKDKNGAYVYCTEYGPSNYMMVDIGNPSYQRWVANKIKEVIYKYGFDGVFLDNGMGVTTGVFWSASGKPINPRTGSYWTNSEVKRAYLEIHPKIKNAIGSKLLIPNGIWRGERFYEYYGDFVELLENSPMDGFMSEGIWNAYNGKWFSEERWKKSLDFLIWVQENYLKGTSRVFVPVCSLRNNPAGCSDYQLASYGIASTLLGIKEGQKQIYLHIGYVEPMKDFGQELFDEANGLGTPLGDYYKVNGVYVREFSNGKVYVNPTNNVYVVDGIKMNAHTGEILLKSSTSAGGCLSGETDIEQDGCNPGETCCCF